MYKKVLVPLDGSALAECALPEVKGLRQSGCIGEVLLLHVVDDPVRGALEGMEVFNLVEIENSMSEQARKYMAAIQSRLASEGIKVQTEVLKGHVSQIIINYAKENNVDLIVIASHGYSGVKQWVFGSVALRVLHDAHVPVLLVRPESHQVLLHDDKHPD